MLVVLAWRYPHEVSEKNRRYASTLRTTTADCVGRIIHPSIGRPFRPVVGTIRCQVIIQRSTDIQNFIARRLVETSEDLPLENPHLATYLSTLLVGRHFPDGSRKLPVFKL